VNGAEYDGRTVTRAVPKDCILCKTGDSRPAGKMVVS